LRQSSSESISKVLQVSFDSSFRPADFSRDRSEIMPLETVFDRGAMIGRERSDQLLNYQAKRNIIGIFVAFCQLSQVDRLNSTDIAAGGSVVGILVANLVHCDRDKQAPQLLSGWSRVSASSVVCEKPAEHGLDNVLGIRPTHECGRQAETHPIEQATRVLLIKVRDLSGLSDGGGR
jgi:hypothetical protein